MSYWWWRVVETFGSKGHFIHFYSSEIITLSPLSTILAFSIWHNRFTTVFARIYASFSTFFKFSHSHKTWKSGGWSQSERKCNFSLCVCRQAEGVAAAGQEPGPRQPEDGQRCLLRVRREGQPHPPQAGLAAQGKRRQAICTHRKF